MNIYRLDLTADAYFEVIDAVSFRLSHYNRQLAVSPDIARLRAGRDYTLRLLEAIGNVRPLDSSAAPAGGMPAAADPLAAAAGAAGGDNSLAYFDPSQPLNLKAYDKAAGAAGGSDD